jgi:uncharacterized RDD family membrane protein YckC
LLRRLAASLYEALVLAAILLGTTFFFVVLFGNATEPPRRYLLQGVLVSAMAVYFCWFWTHGGQTLPMKTWRLKLVRADGGPLSMHGALLRFLVATLGLAALGVSWWWMVFDREGCALHDRLCGTRVLSV